jgi:hypothetical protein
MAKLGNDNACKLYQAMTSQQRKSLRSEVERRESRCGIWFPENIVEVVVRTLQQFSLDCPDPGGFDPEAFLARIEPEAFMAEFCGRVGVSIHFVALDERKRIGPGRQFLFMSRQPADALAELPARGADPGLHAEYDELLEFLETLLLTMPLELQPPMRWLIDNELGRPAADKHALGASNGTWYRRLARAREFVARELYDLGFSL